MAGVISAAGIRPAPRFAPLVTPWESAEWREGATADGPFVAIEVIDPLDPPALPLRSPPSYEFSTDSAVLPSGWYMVVFLDAAGNEGPTDPFAGSGFGVALPPSAAEVRLRSEYLKVRYPADPIDADIESGLREAVLDATVLVESMTCRTLDAALAADPRLARLALRAVTLKTEQLGVRSKAKAAAGVAGGQLLRSFTAGPYSESYFGPEEAAKARVLDPNPALHEALWALATEECRQKWLELWSGEFAPAAAVQTFNWRGVRTARRYY